jgi:hypothetical protein
MIKLDPEFKKKWLEALRSGKYKQGKNVLYDAETNCFCCLGVAGDLCEIPKEKLIEVGCKILSAKEFRGYKIPLALSERDYTQDELQRELAEMNDNGKTFLQIADHIEANF